MLSARVGWLVLAVLVLGCGQDTASNEVHKLADKLCVCADEACIASVDADFRAWSAQISGDIKANSKRKDLETAVARYARCHDKASPSTP